MPTMSSVPTMACTTPPPVSPAGAGVWVKKSSERLPAPLSTRLSRMKNSGSSATTTAPIISPTIKLLRPARRTRRFTGALLPAPEPAGHPPDEQPRAGVHQHRDHEEQEGDVGQGGEVHVADRLGELVGDRRRHGVAGREQRGRDLVPVADQHGDRHRLAQRPAEPEDDRADDPGAGVGQNGGGHRLPPGGAERERGLPLGVGHRQQHLPGRPT